jgi:hypothetical protein
MSEKTQQKKDGQGRNKNNRRMRAATSDVDKKAAGRKTGRAGKIKSAHRIESTSKGFNDYGNQT